MSFSALRTKTLLRVFRSRFTEDITFLLAITLAAGFYAFEKNLPYSEYTSFVLTILAITAWLWLSFASGFMRRSGFVVFSLIYWLVPNLVIIMHTARVEERDYNAGLHTLSRFSELFVRAPLDSVSEILNINVMITSIALLLFCELMFFLGFLYRGTCRNRHWYRVFRERYEI